MTFWAGGPVDWNVDRLADLSKHEDKVRAFCRSRLGNDADAEDAAQDAFIRFLVSPAQIENPEAWLTHAAACAVVDLLRRGWRRRAQFLSERSSSDDTDPCDEVVWRHTAEWMLEQLRPDDRLLLQRLYMDGYSVEQVAVMMGVPPPHVRVMAMRARKRAQRILGTASALVGVPLLLPLLRGLRGALGWARRAADRVAAASRSAADMAAAAPFVDAASSLAAPAATMLVLALISGTAVPTLTPPLVPSPSLAAATAAVPPGSGADGPGAPQSQSGNGATAPALPPDGGLTTDVHNLVSPSSGAPQQYNMFTSMTPSPHYQSDHTVIASGTQVYGCTGSCATIYETRDAGHSWQQLPTTGFTGRTLLLPPDWPADPMMFAVSMAGLEVSRDGHTFTLALPGVNVAAVDPTSAPGQLRLLVGGPAMLWYNTTTGGLTPGPVLPATMTGVTSLFVGAGGAVLASGYEQDPLTLRGEDAVLLRCAPSCVTLDTEPGALALTITPSADVARDGGLIAYSARELLTSNDGGATFRATSLSSADSAMSIEPLGGGALLGIWAEPDGRERLGVVPAAAPTVDTVGAPILGAQPAFFSVIIGLPDRWFVALYFTGAPADLGILCSTDHGAHWVASC
ncbi:MAG: RNA polymerase sigma factor [Candidatus Dormibacteria bacterium]